MNKRIIVAILIVLTIATPVVYAADIRLSSSCSLADAIIAANSNRAEGGCPAGRGADTIALTRDITLDGGLPKITSIIIIEGNGYTISGDNRWRIFYNEGGALTIKDLTLIEGRAEGELIYNADGEFKATTAQPLGGAIHNWRGTVTISDSVFSGNSAEVGGAISNGGELSISESSFSHNSADGLGGAISNGGELSISESSFSHNSAENGGAILNVRELSIINSSFSHNSAEVGGVISNGGELSISESVFSDNSAEAGGAILNMGELSIINSAFSDNLAEQLGGAINNVEGELSITNNGYSGNSADGFGGAIANAGELSITNNGYSGNSAEDGGAIANGGDGELSIVSSTFSGNSDKYGGAILNWGELSIFNSIIAGNGGNACYSESRLRRNISNLIEDGSCSPAFSGDPMLGELVEPEDGSPAYFLLLAGSPAIDAADDDYCPATDQIGAARPQGAGCDIGAIEYAAS